MEQNLYPPRHLRKLTQVYSVGLCFDPLLFGIVEIMFIPYA
jgi:hypothetical protein